MRVGHSPGVRQAFNSAPGTYIHRDAYNIVVMIFTPFTRTDSLVCWKLKIVIADIVVVIVIDLETMETRKIDNNVKRLRIYCNVQLQTN